MKTVLKLLLAACLVSIQAFGQVTSGPEAFATLRPPRENEKVATFAGGCFWSLAECFSELKGVNQVVSGYSGGRVKNPSYEQVCSKQTGHAESVQVYYDPAVINYSTLVQAFFSAHDPTTQDQQGPDVGPEYRSVAFYRSPEEKQIIDNMARTVNNSHPFSGPVVTQVIPFRVFYPAENYHQNYYRLHPTQPYIVRVSREKVLKLRKAMAGYLKAEFSKPSS